MAADGRGRRGEKRGAHEEYCNREREREGAWAVRRATKEEIRGEFGTETSLHSALHARLRPHTICLQVGSGECERKHDDWPIIWGSRSINQSLYFRIRAFKFDRHMLNEMDVLQGNRQTYFRGSVSFIINKLQICLT